jgi:hypothetical protein
VRFHGYNNNMLGVGLHLYGFMDKAFWPLLVFIASIRPARHEHPDQATASSMSPCLWTLDEP